MEQTEQQKVHERMVLQGSTFACVQAAYTILNHELDRTKESHSTMVRAVRAAFEVTGSAGYHDHIVALSQLEDDPQEEVRIWLEVGLNAANLLKEKHK